MTLVVCPLSYPKTLRGGIMSYTTEPLGGDQDVLISLLGGSPVAFFIFLLCSMFYNLRGKWGKVKWRRKALNINEYDEYDIKLDTELNWGSFV